MKATSRRREREIACRLVMVFVMRSDKYAGTGAGTDAGTGAGVGAGADTGTGAGAGTRMFFWRFF